MGLPGGRYRRCGLGLSVISMNQKGSDKERNQTKNRLRNLHLKKYILVVFFVTHYIVAAILAYYLHFQTSILLLLLVISLVITIYLNNYYKALKRKIKTHQLTLFLFEIIDGEISAVEAKEDIRFKETNKALKEND